ncbi:Methyl-accepting chemotaxis protein McpS [compost metagenome]
MVADEVRSLAQRTQQSTEEIEELIAGLQSGTQRVASVMDASRQLTDSSVELTRRAGTSLETITRTVSSIWAHTCRTWLAVSGFKHTPALSQTSCRQGWY